MTVALGGLDALAFTGGVGEHSARVRAAICRRLAFLGVVLDDQASEKVAGEATISTEHSTVRVQVVPAREDVVIARAVRTLLATP
jgi:acetate kinase